jgi:predicted NBD/HSP70 family sugar kinase
VAETIRRRGSSKGRALDLIRSEGPISRVELAELTGLTQATISNVVRELLVDGVVSETGRGESSGGKPRMRLEINPASRFGVGVHLGADSSTFVVADLAGTIIGRLGIEGPGALAPADYVRRMADDLAHLLDGLDIDRAAVVGLGIAAPGPIDREAGVIVGAPSLAAWNRFPLVAELSRLTGFSCVLDNDATAAALGEFWLGAIESGSTYASVYMGTGIGAGIVFDGTVYRGSRSNVGELGHVSVDARGPECPCGNRGCVELYAGPHAVIARARQADASSGIDLEFTGSAAVDFAAVAEAAITGHPLALALIEDSAEYLAEAIVSMVNLIDLDHIVLAGSAFAKVGAIYVRTIQRIVGERSLSRHLHQVSVRMSVNGTDAAALGAATMVLQEQLSPRSLQSVTLA